MKLPKIKIPVFESIALAAVLIIIERILFPQLTFDTNSLILFAIAAGCISLPRLLQILPPLKRAKYGDLEFEFDEAIRSLERRVKEAEAKPSTPIAKMEEQPRRTGARPHVDVEIKTNPLVGFQSASTAYPPMRERYVKDYYELLASSTSNTEKIIAASILTEEMLTQTAHDLDLLKPEQRRNPHLIAQALAEHGFISSPEVQAFDEFWKLRNNIVHGKAPPPTDVQTARVLDLLWRLVRTLA